MADDYVKISEPDILPWDGARWRREFFLRDHHHLYSPWVYTPQQIRDRNKRLLQAQWDAS
jgi:hypothetical protein